LQVSFGNALASAVSVALPPLGVAPVESRERQEVVRSATTRGSVSSASRRTGGEAEVMSIGKKRNRQMPEEDARRALIQNVTPVIVANGTDAPRRLRPLISSSGR